MPKLPLSKLKLNPKNPRFIRDEKFEKLKKSLKDFPEMMEARPIVIDENNMILGGNMRFRAAKELGWKEVPVQVLKGLTEDKKNEFVIKDNAAFGEWDWELLANEWDAKELNEWGIDIPSENDSENEYSTKIEPLQYEIKNKDVKIEDTFDLTKYKELVDEIENSKISNEQLKELLLFAATRHIKFSYSKIADLYASLNKKEQLLFEKSALVIIDIKDAMNYGYIKTVTNILDDQ